MGKPSFRSDVFALGLICYRMLSGQLPEWPFQWPPPGHQRLRRRVHPEMVELIRRAIEIDPRRRFAHAGTMLTALKRIKFRTLQHGSSGPAAASPRNGSASDWRALRLRQFQRRFGKVFGDPPHLPALRGPGVRGDDRLPLVRGSPRDPRRHDTFPSAMPALPSGTEAGLDLLSLVLRGRIRRADGSPVHRHSLHCPVLQYGLFAAAADAIHAVLPLVPTKGPS